MEGWGDVAEDGGRNWGVARREGDLEEPRRIVLEGMKGRKSLLCSWRAVLRGDVPSWNMPLQKSSESFCHLRSYRCDLGFAHC